MNVRLPAICWLLLCLVMPVNLLAEYGENSERHSIRVQVLLVESSGNLDQDERRQLSGPNDLVKKALKEFTAEGKATIVNQAELTVLVEQQTMLQVGETVSLRTGSMRTGSGREAKVYKDVSIGTLIKLMTKVVGEHVLIDMDFSKSFVTPGGDDDPERPQGTSQLSHQSTLRIKNGNAQLIGRMMSRQSGDGSRAVQLIVATDVLDSSETGQTTRFQSFSRQPTRTSSASSRSDSRSSSGAFLRSSSDEARRRFGTTMFDRADANDDGMVSESELARLGPRDTKAKPPITKEQYLDWISSKWPPSRSSRVPPSSGRRPSSFRPQVRPQRIEIEEEIEVKREEGDEESEEEENEKDEGEHGEIGDTRIEFVPELGTIIIRGAKLDVERVMGVIKQIEERDDEEEDDDNEDEGDD
jgi:hypothetical protein